MTEFERAALAEDRVRAHAVGVGRPNRPRPHAEGLDMATMMHRWHEGRRVHAMPTLAEEISAVEQEEREQNQVLREQHEVPAWIPDDTWPVTHEQVRRQQAERAAGRRVPPRPPTAA